MAFTTVPVAALERLRGLSDEFFDRYQARYEADDRAAADKHDEEVREQPLRLDERDERQHVAQPFERAEVGVAERGRGRERAEEAEDEALYHEREGDVGRSRADLHHHVDLLRARVDGYAYRVEEHDAARSERDGEHDYRELFDERREARQLLRDVSRVDDVLNFLDGREAARNVRDLRGLSDVYLEARGQRVLPEQHHRVGLVAEARAQPFERRLLRNHRHRFRRRVCRAHPAAASFRVRRRP